MIKDKASGGIEVQGCRTDHAGRLTLPATLLDAIGIGPNEDVVVERTDGGVLMRPPAKATPITDRIAALHLPVSDWAAMKAEVNDGQLGIVPGTESNDSLLDSTERPHVAIL